MKWKGNYEQALTFLSQLKAKTGIWGVTGGYDYSSPRKSCLFCHNEGSGSFTKLHKVRFLRNSFEKINLPNGAFWIGGIDIEREKTFSSIETCTKEQIKHPCIILSHNPLSFNLFLKDKDFFMIAGDTHGGQVPIPSLLLRITGGYKKNIFYNCGFFEDGKKKMFVSRGIGTSHLPIRLFRRPEVVVLHFTP